MKFFADHCFFARGVEFLRKQGYDVIKAIEVGLEDASDKEIIPFCRKEKRIILTLDRDFTSLYRFPLGTHKGIVVLRINPFNPSTLIESLTSLTERKLFTRFKDALVIVRRNKITIVRPGGSTEVI